MKIVNGTYYHDETPEVVIYILEKSRKENMRIEIIYGNVKTGDIWEGSRNIGTVSRSGGDIKIPILLYNKRSIGGPGLIEHCILEIRLARKQKYGSKILYKLAIK